MMHRLVGLLALSIALIGPAQALDIQATTVPGRAPSVLSNGEIAINRADKRLIFKNVDGSLGFGSLMDALPAGRKAVVQGDGGDLTVAPGLPGAATRKLSELLLDTITLRVTGVKCDGTDETTKIQAAIDTVAANGQNYLRVPYGVCTFSTLTVPDGVTLAGGSPLNSILRTNSAAAHAVTLGAASSVRNLGFTSSVVRTGGSFIYTQKNGAGADGIICSGSFVCFWSEGIDSTPEGVAIGTYIQNATIQNAVGGNGSGLVYFRNYSNAIARNVVGGGTAGAVQPDFGIRIRNGDTAFVSDSNITQAGIALLIDPQANENSYATWISNSIFDSAGRTALNAPNIPSCRIAPQGNGNVLETSMVGVWCGLARADGIQVYADTGKVDGLHITGLMADGNGISGAGHGVNVGNGVTNWSINGGQASGNVNGAGYFVGGSGQHWSIRGVRAGCMVQRGCNLQGLNISGGTATDYYRVVDNDFSGSTSFAIFDGGTGTHKIIRDNFQ